MYPIMELFLKMKTALQVMCCKFQSIHRVQITGCQLSVNHPEVILRNCLDPPPERRWITYTLRVSAPFESSIQYVGLV